MPKQRQPVHTDDGRTKEPNGSLADAMPKGNGQRSDEKHPSPTSPKPL